MDIDLSPLLTLLLTYLGYPLLVVIGLLAVAFGMRAYKRLGLGNDEIVRGYLQEAMRLGVDFALTKAKVKLGQPVTVTIRNQVIADAADYAIKAAPAAIKHFGITEQGVIDRIVARLPDTLREEVQQAGRPAPIGVGWTGAEGEPQPEVPAAS